MPPGRNDDSAQIEFAQDRMLEAGAEDKHPHQIASEPRTAAICASSTPTSHEHSVEAMRLDRQPHVLHRRSDAKPDLLSLIGTTTPSGVC